MSAETAGETPAHDQPVSHHYTVHYPAHPARKDDPHYRDFDAFHRKYGPTARCEFALRFEDKGAPAPVLGGHGGYTKRLIGDGELAAECDITHPLELHHAHVEFSLQNGVDLTALEKDYPGISNPDEVGAWVESGANFQWLCQKHHRGHGGAHVASASDYEAEKYVRGLIT